MAKPPTQQPQHGVGSGPKKQVRRRLHSSRPYQERLLNMAEARKEIVTALKFHRAAMKQANEKNHHHHQLPHQHHLHSTSSTVADHPGVQKFSSTPFNYYYYPPYSINICSPAPIIYQQQRSSEVNVKQNDFASEYETLDIALPKQTLGLNLNLQAFADLDAHSAFTPPAVPNRVSPSSSSTSEPEAGVGPASESGGAATRPTLDEDEMAEIRLIGEKHEIEWDDTLNLVKSAWWLKCINTVDLGDRTDVKGAEELKEFTEFPPWMSTQNEGLLQQRLDCDFSPLDCDKDTNLPWMDIEDIDGMDDEWLS